VTISLQADVKKREQEDKDRRKVASTYAFVDIRTFRQILAKVSQSIEEERAIEQLINLLKVSGSVKV